MLDHPDGDLRWAHVAELHAEIVDGHRAATRPAAVITFGEDGLYWHLDHIGVHERTTTAVRSLGADAPPLYYVTMPHGVMRDDRRGRASRRAGRRRPNGLLEHRAGRVRRRRRAADVRRRRRATGCRASSPPSGATARRWGATIRSRGSTTRDARRLARRRALSPRAADRPRRRARAARRARSLERRPSHAHRHCSTSCAARTAAAASSSSTSMFHRRDGDEIHDGILGCHCCIFPVVDGIPVLHLQPDGDRGARARRGRAARTWRCARWSASTTTAQADALRGGRRVGHGDVPRHRRGARARTSRAATSSTASPIRPSSSRSAVVRAVAGTVLRRQAAGDRRLRRLGPPDAVAAGPVVAGRRCSPICTFAKIWLARRFTAPGCEPVCCDGNAPLPFARGAFGYAMCSDAFLYIWTKRQFVGEMVRLVDGPDEPGAVVINHTHNQLHVEPVARPAAVARRATAICSRRSSRASSARPASSRTSSTADRSISSRRDAAAALDADPALTHRRQPRIRASSRRTRSTAPARPSGEFRRQPALRRRAATATALRLRLQFPVRGLRGGVRRLPAVPAGRSRRSTRGGARRARRPAGTVDAAGRSRPAAGHRRSAEAATTERSAIHVTAVYYVILRYVRN